MKKFMPITLILLVVIIFSALLLWPPNTVSRINRIQINDSKITVEIVNNPYSRYRGLSGREELCADCGMLFVFPWQVKQTFVMRRMKFPLDIIWIKGDTVVKIDKNLPPEEAIPKNFYSSGEPIDYVLEVNGGFTDKNNIRVGDVVKFIAQP